MILVRMTTMRTYGDGCAIARALDLVGERWALLVVRELLLGPKRYTDLRRGLPNASPNVLSHALRELERAGVIRRRKLPPPAGARVYELTAWGRELEETVMSLGRWAARSPTRAERRSDRSADSIILALRSLFDPGAAHGLRAALRAATRRRSLSDRGGRRRRSRSPAGSADQADATIDTDPDTLAAVLWGGPAARRRATLGEADDRGR